MSIEITAALAAVTAAAKNADFAFWVSDDDGDSVRSEEFFASTAQAIESLTDPGEGWVRVDESAWGQRQANPLAGYVADSPLQDAINTAFEAEIDVADITAAINAGRA
jgi:hypothetical protein